MSILIGLLVYAVGWLSKGYCLANGWGAPQRYMYLCYSDIPILYSARGLADGAFPYLLDPGPGQQVLEYPVLTGVFMYVAAWVTRLLGGDSQTFFGGQRGGHVGPARRGRSRAPDRSCAADPGTR